CARVRGIIIHYYDYW
nr:immunoglobulin heavy chain junction region [Macaca mulatta]MOW23730.1 immunoglobulin heavy chain junction region [Macaca mulatta]MOW23752.1 immunoglobulin heavy chain junction region [Macaca mulatta]MOW24197.1 immunoglobulin heavy chain junction region [Macaca mulatta]MOW24827.1 immunoglobulin heavy chain junction region [Macaca mulatta]